MAVSINLRFTNGVTARHSPDPYFLSDKGVEGQITVRDPLRYGVDLIKVSLEGILLNSVSHAGGRTAQPHHARKLQVLLRMTDIKKPSEFTRTIRAGKPVAKCSFRFHIPQCLGRNLLGEDSEYLSDLPASLSCYEKLGNTTQTNKASIGESQVHYTIRAEVIRFEVMIGATSRTIRIIPTLQPRPPVCYTDFGSEYTTQSTKAVRAGGRMSISKTGSCTIEAIEPAPVVISQLGGPITISVPLKITLQTAQCNPPNTRRGKREEFQFQEQHRSLQTEDGKCSGSLVSSTFISVLPRRGVPTELEVEEAKSVTRNIAVCSRTCTPIDPSTDWTYHRNLGCWQSSTAVKLTFDSFMSDEPLLPSFDSSLISHRYRLALKIQVNAPYRMTFTLKVPVMLRYCSRVGDDPPAFDDIAPMVDHTSSNESADDLEQRLASMHVEDLLRDQNQYSMHYADADTPAYHPRTVGIAAPPYVV